MTATVAADGSDAAPSEGVATSHAPTVEAGLRDRKKQATQRALRNVALRLVAERGFAHVTVEEIAEAADVATRTFFNYYPSKFSAVIGSSRDRIEHLRDALLARPSEESPLEALRAVLVESIATYVEELDDLDGGGDVWFARFNVFLQDPELLSAYSAHHAETERVLVDALSERLGTDPATDPYPALVTACALAAGRVASIYWSAGAGGDSLPRLTAVAIDSLASGFTDRAPLAPPSGGMERSAAPSRKGSAR